MKKPIYKDLGKTIWYIEFDWIDDQTYNQGFKKIHDVMVSTIEDFKEYMESQEKHFGLTYGNVKKRHATADEIGLL